MTARSSLLATISMPAMFVLLAFATAASTAQAEVGDADRAKAAAHFKQAQAFFQRADFDRALAEYQAAYELSAEPSLIFNIALCHDRADRPEEALQAFRRYLELAPDGAVADEAREDVARLTPIVDQRAAERAAAQAAAQARQREALAPHAPARAISAPRAEPSRVPRYVIATGAVIAVAGAVSHALAWRTRERLGEPASYDAYWADRPTFQLQRNLAIGAYAAGALTIATGWILGRTVYAHDDGPRLSAQVTPDGAAVTVAWSR